MINTKNEALLNKKLSLPFVTIAVMLGISALTGIVPQLILTLGIVACLGLLVLYDKLYLAFPFVIFYNSFYGMALGVSVLRIYTLLVLGNMIIRLTSKSSLKARYLPPLFVYTVYLIAVMMPFGISSAAYILLDILCCFIVVYELIRRTEALKEFFSVYTLVCLVSFLSGMVAGNYIGDEYNYSRFMATFEDPNYMGFFFTIAIFALVTLKLFDKRIRYILIVALYAMILTSLSLTAIVVNIVLWLFYLIIMKKLKAWSVFIIALVVLLAFTLYDYGLANPDTPFIGDLSARIEDTLSSVSSGNFGDATTGRFDLSREHLDYYLSASPMTVLFGGIPVNPRQLHPDFTAAAHNEYIDMLLNVGLLGTVIMLGYFIATTYSHLKKYKKTNDERYLFLVVGKTVWACYAMTLTMFLDYRFMLMFLI